MFFRYQFFRGLDLHAYAHICGYVLQVEILTAEIVSVDIHHAKIFILEIRVHKILDA